MGDKEALERSAALLERNGGEWPPNREERADIAKAIRTALALIAEREGLEREVAYTENRRAHWQHEAEVEHSRAAVLAIDYENMSINRDTLKARAEAATAQLSALQEACKTIARARTEPHHSEALGGADPLCARASATVEVAREALRALLPTVPVEGS